MSSELRLPQVAVIVVGYRPRPYLRTAVESVLSQSLPRSQMEVLVQTGFSDPTFQDWLAGVGVRHRFDAEPRLGRWLLGALDATQAPLVAIVEDDDVLEADRLERALAQFARYPDLGYYRNRLTVIDAKGQALPATQWKRIEQEHALDRRGAMRIEPGQKEGAVAKMRAEHLEWLNLSTMVFRREIFGPTLRPVVAECQCPDLFTFVAAVLAPGGLYLDDHRLTRYRRHGQSATRSLSWHRLHAEDHRRMLAVAEAGGAPPSLVAWLRDRAQMLGRVVQAGEALEPIRALAPRAVSTASARRYLRHLAGDSPLAPPAALRWSTGAIASAYQVAPRLTHRLLRECDQRFELP